MELILKNLKKVLTKSSSLFATIISIFLIWSLFTYFKNAELIIGNLGLTFFISEIALDVSISLLFWLFVWSSIYKIIYFSAPKNKQLWIGWLASFFWILVWGCPR